MKFKKKINRQGLENMAADVLGEEEEITSEPVFEILKSNTDMDMVSRLGIVLPDNQILKPDKTLANPVNGITFDELNGKAAFITNMEPDNLETDKFVLFLNVTIERENKPVGVLFGVSQSLYPTILR